MIANIALHDALILPHRANPAGLNFRERQHYFDPNKAAFQDFDPFWEFVSGPIHAGTGFQNQIDLTFGPQVVYVKARPRDPAVLGGPADGLQFFGHVAIDGATEVMTVTLKDAADTALWSRQIEPQAA